MALYLFMINCILSSYLCQTSEYAPFNVNVDTQDNTYHNIKNVVIYLVFHKLEIIDIANAA